MYIYIHIHIYASNSQSHPYNILLVMYPDYFVEIIVESRLVKSNDG